MPDEFNTFVEAFSVNAETIRSQCACGKLYYEGDESCAFNDNEYEALVEDPNAFDVENVHLIEINQIDYVECCSCWHEQARDIMNFLDNHSSQVGQYLNLSGAQLVVKQPW